MNLPRDAPPLHTFECLSGIRLAAVPARGTEERRGATWTCSASSGLQRAPSGALACFPESGSGPMGLGAAVVSTGICVSQSAFGPGSIAITGPKSERRKGASKGWASCGQESHWVQLLSGVALQAR